MGKQKLGEVTSVAVQKGGVGKSTYANALAYSFANKGYKTILVDLDPQATQTGAFMGYGYGVFSGENISNLANVFKDGTVVPIQIKTIKYTDNPNKNKMYQPHYLEEDLIIDFIPSNPDLLTMTESDELNKKEKIDSIVNFIKDLQTKYDRIVIDSPPTFGIITTAVLISSNNVLTPIPTKNVDTDGMVGFFRNLDRIFEEVPEMNLRKILILPNMFDKRLSDAKATLRDIQRTPNFLQETKNLRQLKCVVAQPIPQRGCIQEAPSYKMFLVPYIMDFSRSKNFDIVLAIDIIVKELDSYSF